MDINNLTAANISFQAASTAVPFFTIQTHGKNTADFVFQVLILWQRERAVK